MSNLLLVGFGFVLGCWSMSVAWKHRDIAYFYSKKLRDVTDHYAKKFVHWLIGQDDGHLPTELHQVLVKYITGPNDFE